MENIYFIIAGFVAALVGVRKPKLALTLGVITLWILYYFTQPFEIESLLITSAIGIPVCSIVAFLTSWIFSGFRGGDHNTGPSFTGSIHGSGSSEGGIVHTDSEINNMNPKNRSK